MNMPPILRALRPHQWSKNGLVGAAIVFASGDRTQSLPPDAWLHALAAIALFCLASSAIYLVNDVRDRELDRQHPTKKFRPIAAGQVSPATALVLAAMFALGSIAAGACVQTGLGLILGVYLIMQTGYCLGLKHVPYLDVLLIAAGFLLRVLAGALAIPVPISHWLLTCTFLLALFLALSKRRHEKVTLQALKDEARPSLRGYHSEVLDHLILLVSGGILTAYALYTVSPDAIRKFGDIRLVSTLPFVAFGLARYWILVYRKDGGGKPEEQLFTDRPTLINATLYGLCLLGLFRF